MVKGQDLFAVGVQYPEIQYEGFLDWFIQFGNLRHQWKHEPSYLLSQLAFLFGGIATFIHAMKKGERLQYLWFGTVLHGFVVESLSYALPDVDNFWHSQSLIMLLGRRLPLHIIFLYPSFIYNASIATAKMRLPPWSLPFAVGMLTVLIDVPYDIIGVNFIHWTWHDTDPNIADRFYWVPWNSFYFHACFAASFTFCFHYSRKLICKDDETWKADSVPKEVICTLIPGVLGTAGGILLFIPIYHPLHDVFKVHSEVTFFVIFTIFLLLIWSGDRVPKTKFLQNHKHKITNATWILISQLVVHYCVPLLTVIFFKPENETAVGLREPVGPCDEYSPIQTPLGLILQKRKFLCLSDYDEKYFDFHCITNKPSNGSHWYTICGVPFQNTVEMVVVISLLCALACVVMGQLHFNSFGDEVFENSKVSSKSKALAEKRKLNKNV